MNTFETFKDLSIPEPLSQALEKMQFTHPTPIQKASIPAGLAGKDILGTAQTGTGKTGAFGIPLLTKVYGSPGQVALVLAPTRELAAQIHQVLRQMAKGMKVNGTLVVGGESFHRQSGELRRGTDYIIATPGRLLDHLKEGTMKLENVNFLVLDEVDRMLDMGFAPQIKQIMKHLSGPRQTLLFSATLPADITSMANKLLKDPIRVSMQAVAQPTAQVTERAVRTTQDKKIGLLLKEVKTQEGKVLIFTRTKSRTDRVARDLGQKGLSVVKLHGGRSQGQRKQALEAFRSGSSRIMVATDLAGRGIDVQDIELVINFDMPGSREDYIHRIGRTGRFGKTGIALSFVCDGESDGNRLIFSSKPPRRGGGGGASRGRRPQGQGGRRPARGGSSSRSGGRSGGSRSSRPRGHR